MSVCVLNAWYSVYMQVSKHVNFKDVTNPVFQQFYHQSSTLVIWDFVYIPTYTWHHYSLPLTIFSQEVNIWCIIIVPQDTQVKPSCKICARCTRKLQKPCKIKMILQENFLARYVTKFLARINDTSRKEVHLLARWHSSCTFKKFSCKLIASQHL